MSKKCKICKKEFTTKALRNRHMSVHTDKKFKCEICSKPFRSNEQLYQHLTVHFKHYWLTKSDIKSMPLDVLCLQYQPFVKPKLLKCSICSKVFNSRPHMRSHMFKHSSVYKYFCGICTKSYKRSDALRLHFFKIHNEHYNNYKDYSYEDEMNYAPANFDVAKNFECDLCHKRFTSKENIRVHMMMHLNLKPFVCEVCSRGFRVRRRLETHLLKHSLVGVKNDDNTDGSNSYECEQMTEMVTDPKLFHCKVVLTRCAISIIVKEEPRFSY